MNALKIYRDAEWALEHNKITLGEFDERIKPLADVEAVVRCKDCKHRPAKPEGGADHGSDYIFPDSICPCQCDGDPWYSWMPHDNWFCADGERKEGDGE